MLQSFGALCSALWARIDGLVLISAVLLCAAGLTTMFSFSGDSQYFPRQLVWIGVSLVGFVAAASVDYRLLRRSGVVSFLYIAIVSLLMLVFMVGAVVKGAQSRFDIGAFSIQPADPAKLILIVVLAKYFARRHVEIARFKHIVVSGAYAGLLAFLVALQPDLGSAVIIVGIWAGVVLASGLTRKHFVLLATVALVSAGVLWQFGLKPYQKQRILTFMDPLSDVRGSGYNAYQSIVAVGSGQIWGKGIGFGSQSRMQFLPEYHTDFMFAAFVEEWGFWGAQLLFLLYAIIITRVLWTAYRGETNFEMLFGVGLAMMFICHFIVHVGINIGLMPVTGTTIPFMSYGGSHLLTEFVGLGMLAGMSAYSRAAHRSAHQKEFVGVAGPLSNISQLR
jgi:rod shape determining protein RodA